MKILTSGQATTAGGKAYHLLELKQAGFLVPNFQILSFDWFQTKESLTWLRQKNKQLSDRKFESLSRELRETARLSLRKELDLALLTSFRQTNSMPCGPQRLWKMDKSIPSLAASRPISMSVTRTY